MGCYRDSPLGHSFTNFTIFSGDLEPNKCFDRCNLDGHRFAGTQFLNMNNHLCFCGNSFRINLIIDLKNCNFKCGLNPSSLCGNKNLSIRIYSLKNRTESYELIAYDVGCFQTIGKVSPTNLNLTNRLAVFKCYEDYKSKYAAIDNEGSYFCFENIQSLNNVSDTKCGGIGTSKMYMILRKMIKLNCPAFVHKDVVFECILQVESLGSCFNLTIDFNDKERRELSFCDGNHSISKSYNSSGLFEIEVSVHNESLNINPNIYVKKAIDYMISPFDYLNNIIEISEYAEYIGCFNAISQSNIFYENSSIQELYNFSHSICFQKCRELDYKFSIIYQGDKCLCSNIYGTHIKLSDHQCKCSCMYNPDSNCGCFFFHLVYRLRDQRVMRNVRAVDLGCHEIINQNINMLIPENTNIACIEFCLNYGKSYNYASTFNKLYCACHTNINLTRKLSNIDCNLECPGNSSQMCGGYFGPRNVYEIKSSFFELISINPKTSIVNQNISIRLGLKSHYNSSEIKIDFGDNQTYFARTIKFDDQFTIQKSYNLSGNYTIKFKIVDQNLQLEADVNVVESLNLTKKIEKIFIYERGTFLNCALQFNFELSINHENYRKNQEVCSIKCAKNNFAYSAVRSSQMSCFCSNTRPNPISDTSCVCACVNSVNRLCGCFDRVRSYEIEKKNEKSQIIGIYYGCFS
ncbi:unnamed protein product, partial [Brachionus calyciflorus]